MKYAGKEALIKQMHSMWSRRGICCMRPRPRQGERGRPKGVAHPRAGQAPFTDIAPIRTIGSVELRRKRFDRPDEVRSVEKARIELVELGELAVGRTVFEPGWRWSEHVKPIVGTETCQEHHRLRGVWASAYRDDRRRSLEILGGDAFEVPPGHDAWVVGDEPSVSIDWAGRRR